MTPGDAEKMATELAQRSVQTRWKRAAWWDRLLPADETARRAVLGGLIGAGGLGTAGAVLNTLRARKKRPLASFLTGAALGGAGGAALGAFTASPDSPSVLRRRLASLPPHLRDVATTSSEVAELRKEYERRLGLNRSPTEQVTDVLGDAPKNFLRTLASAPSLTTMGGGLSGIGLMDYLISTGKMPAPGRLDRLLANMHAAAATDKLPKMINAANFTAFLERVRANPALSKNFMDAFTGRAPGVLDSLPPPLPTAALATAPKSRRPLSAPASTRYSTQTLRRINNEAPISFWRGLTGGAGQSGHWRGLARIPRAVAYPLALMSLSHAGGAVSPLFDGDRRGSALETPEIRAILDAARSRTPSPP